MKKKEKIRRFGQSKTLAFVSLDWLNIAANFLEDTKISTLQGLQIGWKDQERGKLLISIVLLLQPM